ncbi:MAG TPA: SH3 domain-containing protein [Cyclobacteriaceae bacterium]
MKLIKTATVLSLLFVNSVRAQNNQISKLDLMQGIWENIMNSESEKAFTIIRGNQSLSFVYNNKTQELNFPLNESIEGFQNFRDSDSISISSIKNEGSYYTIVDKRYVNASGWVQAPFFLTPNYFECDGELMSINGGQLVEYSKMNELPFEALDKLFKRGRLDKRDYIKEYLNLRVLSVRPSKGKVYSSPNKQKEVFLNQDDIVIVIEENNKWAKIKYSEGEGWVRKGDLK